jgi:CRISPR/Cas system-associated exonuclease Cas4 (RecB family)
MTLNRFKAQELCTRKLWELVKNNPEEHTITDVELSEAIHELAQRRHDLAELYKIGKLDKPN